MVGTVKNFLCCLLMTSVVKCNAQNTIRNFDIGRHLSTRSRYAGAKRIPGAPNIHSTPDPEGCIPVHLYLVARHGTRWPTKDRMKQMDSLEEVLKSSGAHQEYEWMRGWRAPFRDLRAAAGELHPIGEHELWSLGTRLRERFPSLLRQPYLPRRYPIISTQVPRAAASASAFAHGFFPFLAPSSTTSNHSVSFSTALPEDPNNFDPNSGSLASASAHRPQPVAITMSPKKADPLLRFFDICPAFLHHEDYTERWLATWMTGTLERVHQRLRDRLRLPDLSPRHVDGLWQLCQVEAGLEGRYDGACQLFRPQEIKLLEWVEDVRLWETQGHGAEVNYRMAAPLLADMLTSLEVAANSSSPEAAARLLFAHAETIVPLASLMGLFKEDLLQQPTHAPIPEPQDEEFERGGHVVEERIAGPGGVDSLEDIPLTVHVPGTPSSGPHYFKGKEADAAPIPKGWSPSVPLKPNRMWTGSRVSPFGANLAVVLYRKESGSSRRSEHIVRLMYNEQFLPIPGCGPDIDCLLESFLDVLRPAAAEENLSLVCGALPGNAAPSYILPLTASTQKIGSAATQQRRGETGPHGDNNSPAASLGSGGGSVNSSGSGSGSGVTSVQPVAKDEL